MLIFNKKNYELEIEKLKNIVECNERDFKEANRQFNQLDRDHSSLKKAYEEVASTNKKLQEFMETVVEGKTLAKHERPEILELIKKYNQLNENLEKREFELAKNKYEWEIQKEKDKLEMEIRLTKELSNQKDSLISALATKAPIQNLLVDKNSIKEIDLQKEKEKQDKARREYNELFRHNYDRF